MNSNHQPPSRSKISPLDFYLYLSHPLSTTRRSLIIWHSDRFVVVHQHHERGKKNAKNINCVTFSTYKQPAGHITRDFIYLTSN